MRVAKTTLAVGLAGLALTAQAHAQSRDFELSGFDQIDIATGINAQVSLAEGFAVTAQSRSQDALDKLELSVENGVLVARIESNFLEFILNGGLVGLLLDGGNAVTLDITLPMLTAATASSGADIGLRAIEGDVLRLDASSGADITLTGGRLGRLDANASSGSDIAVSGSAQRVHLNASSGSDIDADDLVAEEGEVEVSSGANISAHLTESVRAGASSGGDIEIAGNPRQRDVDASSGGEVNFDD